MKKIFWSVFSLAFALATQSFSQENGIQFADLSWSEAKLQAEKENKLIFIDAYTTWCGPCKRMDKSTFKDKTVGAYFNEHFINLKVDMEKGEGLMIADKYKVIVYPTLLFVDQSGNVMHRSAGFHNTDQFLDLGKQALDPGRQLATLNMRYAQGDRDPEFLKSYAAARFEVQDGSHQRIAEAFLDTRENWDTEECRDMIYSYTSNTDTPMFDYLIKTKTQFISDYGEANVQEKLNRLINRALLNGDELVDPETARALFDRVNPEKAALLSAQHDMQYHRKKGDRESFANAAINYVASQKEPEWSDLNDIAWTFGLVIEDESLLKSAVKWTKQSIKLDGNYYNHDTLAVLYHKLEKKGKARKAAQKAIKYAMVNAIDSSETEKLLEQIKAL